MRLTEKTEYGSYWTPKPKGIRETLLFKEELTKLGQLEDIEEKLGIDLVTLFKALENDIWIKFDDSFIFVPYDKKEFVFYEGNINCYPNGQKITGYTVSIDKYGFQWALTKEELK